MIVLILQTTVLLLLVAAVAIWCIYFPYPSPFIRRWLSPSKRWPETQVRNWLAGGKFQPAFLKYFYRDPERIPPPGQEILAPADGLVTSAEVRNGIRYLVIALSFWDMHVQRSPISGRVARVESLGSEFVDGEGRGFAFLREKTCPVQKRLVLETHIGEMAVRLITSLAARRIETWVNEGQEIKRGQRIGRILLGSTVVLEMPIEPQIVVRTGERVRAGETPVATLPMSA